METSQDTSILSQIGAILKERPMLFELVVDRIELSHRLMISPSLVSKLMAEESLPHIKIGRTVRFDVEEVRSWLKERRKP